MQGPDKAAEGADALSRAQVVNLIKAQIVLNDIETVLPLVDAAAAPVPAEAAAPAWPQTRIRRRRRRRALS